MAYASRQGRARISSRTPQAAGQCDRCGFLYTHAGMKFQYDWRGSTLQNTQMLVCTRCYDTPQDQLRSIVIPADPMPIRNPRIPDYVTAGSDARLTSGLNAVDANTGIPVPGGDTRTTQDDAVRVLQQTGEAPGGLNRQPGTDANAPGNASPGLPYNNTEVPKTGPLNGEAP